MGRLVTVPAGTLQCHQLRDSTHDTTSTLSSQLQPGTRSTKQRCFIPAHSSRSVLLQGTWLECLFGECATAQQHRDSGAVSQTRALSLASNPASTAME